MKELIEKIKELYKQFRSQNGAEYTEVILLLLAFVAFVFFKSRRTKKAIAKINEENTAIRNQIIDNQNNVIDAMRNRIETDRNKIELMQTAAILKPWLEGMPYQNTESENAEIEAVEENLFLGTIADVENKVKNMNIEHDLFEIMISVKSEFFDKRIQISNRNITFTIEEAHLSSNGLYLITVKTFGEDIEVNTIDEISDFINKRNECYLPKMPKNDNKK